VVNSPLLKEKKMSQNVWVKCGRVYTLFPEPGVAAATVGATIFKDSPYATFQMYGSTTANGGTAVATIQGSNIDNTNAFVTLGTITLTLGTTSVADGFTTTAPWKYVRANVTTLTGTGAVVQILMGV
jgi:hypothetical protein